MTADTLSFDRPPGIGGAYLRLLADRRPGQARAPATDDLTAALAPIPAERPRLKTYRQLCGFPDDGFMPVTWPHIMTGAVHLAMLAAPAFPARGAGLVHVDHRIDAGEPILDTAVLGFRCRIPPWEAVEGGHQRFELHTEALLDDRVVWSEVLGFLARAPRKRGTPPTPEPAQDELRPASTTSWAIGGDVGRRYARVSGDWNPIHLSRLTARPFGFRRAIAHGMWTLARTIALVEGQAGRHIRSATARFRRPLYLPAEACAVLGPIDDGCRFALADARREQIHLEGRAELRDP